MNTVVSFDFPKNMSITYPSKKTWVWKLPVGNRTIRSCNRPDVVRIDRKPQRAVSGTKSTGAQFKNIYIIFVYIFMIYTQTCLFTFSRTPVSKKCSESYRVSISCVQTNEKNKVFGFFFFFHGTHSRRTHHRVIIQN